MPRTFELTLSDQMAAEVARELRQRQVEEPDLTEAQLIHQHATQYWAMRARETAQAQAATLAEITAAFLEAPEEKKLEARRALGLDADIKAVAEPVQAAVEGKRD